MNIDYDRSVDREVDRRYDLLDDDLDLAAETALNRGDRANVDDLVDAFPDAVAHAYLGGSCIDDVGYDDVDMIVEFDDDLQGPEHVQAYDRLKDAVVEELDATVREEHLDVRGRYVAEGIRTARLRFDYFGLGTGVPHHTRFDITV